MKMGIILVLRVMVKCVASQVQGNQPELLKVKIHLRDMCFFLHIMDKFNFLNESFDAKYFDLGMSIL